MSSMPDKSWTIQHATQTYAINSWGEGYFAINNQGHVCVRPSTDQTVSLDLYDIAQSLSEKQLSLPVLVRFTDILKDRVTRLNRAFAKACEQHGYQGAYTPVYPIKVNQQRQVVEGILAADTIGLEAGSKPELLAIMALSKTGGVVVCNGYKDRAYIRLALMGLAMGLKLYLVIEKPLELELIIEESAKLAIKPSLGLRVRLSSISAGKWQNSGGEKSKFGLHAHEVLQLIERLKQADLLDCLHLMHFHMGSQIANIHDIKIALKEAGQFYVELRRLGANISIVDAGGGLGVDYDGSKSRRESSMNYSVEEYAHNIVRSFSAICAEKQQPQPAIFTESGRALTAHHAVLITNVTDIETVYSNAQAQLNVNDTNLVETYHDAQFQLAQARTQFATDKLSINGLAQAENDYAILCQQIQHQLNAQNQNEAAILQELDEKLADKVFCNFSLFQSLPDIWGIDQVFPIMPIHRLNEKPTRRAVIQDLTCDSDGRIDCYIDGHNLENTLPLHSINLQQPYLIGFFMVGAYQEILGDMHNLFGDTHSINIKLDEKGYHFYDLQEGEDVSELLDYVHISSEELKRAYRNKLVNSQLTMQQQNDYEQELIAGLNSYTYLER